MSEMEERLTGVQLTQLPALEMEEYAARAVERSRTQAAQLRRQRQAEGIAAAKARGVQFGRPRAGFSPHFAAVVRELDNKTITTETAQRLCGMTRSTFSRRLQRYRQECGINK